MKRIQMIFSLFLFISLISCSLHTIPPMPIELLLDTAGSTDIHFHSLKKNLDFDYDGFHVVIEKTKREIILGINQKTIPEISIDNIHALKVLPNPPEALKANIKSHLSGDKMMFVSQIFYTEKNAKNFEIFNMYGKDEAAFSKEKVENGFVYKSSLNALDTLLRNALIDRIERSLLKKTYTHIIFLSTGWNNTLKNSIGSYNKWTEGITDPSFNTTDCFKNYDSTQKNEALEFNPLFITISWPSQWRFLGMSVPLSFGIKSNDADEIGLLYANFIVNKIMLDQKFKKLNKVLVGHSFGSRILTRAFFSKGLFKKEENDSENIDTIIGFQPAFSIKRFDIKKANDDNGEGYPYRIDKNMKTKFVFIWSLHDKAGKLIPRIIRSITKPREKWYMLGKSGWKKSKKILKNEYISKTSYIKLNRDYTLVGKDSKADFNNSNFLYIEASSCIKKHNDVFKTEHGRLIRSIICY